MDFDSHTSDVVTAAVGAVNLLTPGWERGRRYTAEGHSGLDDVLAPRDRHRHRAVPDEEIARLRDWTDRLHTVFAAVEAGDLDAACATVNALIAETGAAPVLARHGEGPWHLHFHAADAGWARSWAASMATALAVVLGNPMHDRLGVCSAPECDRVFVDVSRNGTKRFCSTACQNRVKAAAFRARRREP
ncbi:CGNR zinc finger protein [Pseudonocardia sediminis]|uniref:CGNR zinc finger protein n=1 Tax=Pseudonocardia sediminis TaxID=1397368 RepID=A0A4Q7UTT2_PSEST|nr:CGNR zinc finger domain-containing protein [Pseudonocardia sediminis]RZT83413.1 CGNR zinc finger protein [Pseudonocardia sediminis]